MTDVKFQNSFDYIILSSMYVQLTLKLFHWNASVYSDHIVSGNLYTTLEPLIDQLEEVFVGKYRNTDKNVFLPLKSFNFSELGSITVLDKADLIELLGSYKEALLSMNYTYKNMVNADIVNIRDTIVAEVNRAIYLFRMQ